MRKLLFLVVVIALLLVVVAPARAHNAGPCNDTNGDGGPDGVDYAHHHIVPADLGNDGHVPGGHGGFSVCLGTGRVFHQP